MRNRRIICFLTGIWLGVSAMLAFTVMQDFNTVDDLLKSPPELAVNALKAAGPDARTLLRYSAGAQNVARFEIWELAQIVFGIVIVTVLFVESSTRKLSILALGMLLLVLFEHFKLTPELAWLARSVEFVPWNNESHVRDQFWNLHRVYTILECVKAALGISLTAVLITQRNVKRVRRRRHHDELERFPEGMPQ